MHNYWVRLDHHRVQATMKTVGKSQELVLNLPCVGGDAYKRERTSLLICYSREYPPRQAEWNDEIIVSPHGWPLEGWGPLNNDDVVVLRPHGCNWNVLMPLSLWEAAAAYATSVL